jgi:hypothetical protein
MRPFCVSPPMKIVKACQHYEDKCSGSYSPSSPAARYLFDLSRDVQDLVRVLKLQEDGLAGRVRELEHLLRDWHAVFGAPDANLAALGISAADGTNTPRHVLRAILQLRGALEDEQTKHAPADGRHAHEVAELRAALRDTGRVGREQASYEVAALQAAARTAVEAERASRTAAEAALRDCRACIAATVEAQVAEQVAVVRAEAAADAKAVAATHASEVGALRAELELAQRRAGAAEAEADAHKRAAQREKQQSSEAIAALREELGQARSSADAEIKALRAQILAQDATWAQALQDRDAAWRASDSIVRATAQEARIAFLTRRLEELERLAEVMQQALLACDGGAQKLSAENNSRGWSGGARTAQTHTLGAPPLPASDHAGGVARPSSSGKGVDVLARVRHSGVGAAEAAGSRAALETEYYAVVA